MTTDEILLYALFIVMTLVAIAFVVPTLAKVGERHQPENEAKEHLAALSDALRQEFLRLEEDKRRGTIAAADYAVMVEDIERRALEERRQVSESTTQSRAFSPAIVIASVTALFAIVTIMGYGLKGSPELMRLAGDQKVLEGKANVEELQIYLKDNRKDGRAWVLLARQLAEKGDFEGAVNAYRTAREVMTKVRSDPTVALEMAAALLTARTPAHEREALPLLQDLHLLNPSDQRVTQLLVMAATDLQEWKIAGDAVESLLMTMSPDNPNYMEARDMLDRLRDVEKRTKNLPPEKPVTPVEPLPGQAK